MKTLNLLFSILFILWCCTILVVWTTDSNFKKIFQFGFGEKSVNYFLELIILTTFFNILARIFNQCSFFLIGAFGLILFALSQIFTTVSIIKNLINGYSNQEEKIDQSNCLNFIILAFPYLIFGILSSLCCYQTKIHQRIDRTQSKLQQLFLQKIPLTNYQMIILIFYLLITVSGVTLFAIVTIEVDNFEYDRLILLLPIIPTISYCFAMKFQKKIFYIFVLLFWGVFAISAAALFGYVIIDELYEKQPDLMDLIGKSSLSLILVIHGFIGFFSILSIYRKFQKKQNQLKYYFENINFIPLVDLNVNHQIEQPSQVNLYADIFDI